MIRLEALTADDTLGALAALGTLRVADTRLSWEPRGRSYGAVLHDVAEQELMDKLGAEVGAVPERAQFRWSDSVDMKRWRHQAELVIGSEAEDWFAAYPSVLDCTKLGSLKLLSAIRKMKPTAEQFREALFGPWRYEDRVNPLGLDPSRVRGGAFTAADPRSMETVSVSGATWLGLQSVPFWRFAKDIVWAAWREPLSARGVDLLLSSGILRRESGPELRSRGIYAVYRSRRVVDNRQAHLTAAERVA